MKKILLFSGGMDSIITNRIVKPDLCVHFDVNVRYSVQERRTVELFKYKKFIKNVVFCPTFNFAKYELNDATVPLRNSYLLSGAVNEALIAYPDEEEFEIYLTVQKDEMSIPDRSEMFIRVSSNLLTALSNRKITLNIPFKYSDKTDMVKEFLGKGWSVVELLYSYSCYNGEVSECGDCACCFRKWVALVNNNIMEMGWLEPPWLSKTAKDYMRRIKEYSKERQERINSALELFK